MTDIFSSSCVLKWEKPEDDGGTPLTYYIIEMMDFDKRELWSEVGEVVSDSTTYKVTNLTEKKRYRFRIQALNKEERVNRAAQQNKLWSSLDL